jgi:glutathione S-transferase
MSVASTQPRLVFHVLPPSHPCAAVEAALRLKELEYEKVELAPGQHIDAMTELYGSYTVPGLLVDDEPVHGSNPIMERLEAIAPEPSLYPADRAEAVRAAAAWGDAELQDLGRRLPWGALYFRPEAMGTFTPGGTPLDPAGTDYAIRFVRGTMKYHRLTMVQVAEDLQKLPALLDQVDAYVSDGLLAGATPNAADFQIGATLSVLLTVGDIRALIESRPAVAVARKWFVDRPGIVPAGAFPAGWAPSTAHPA